MKRELTPEEREMAIADKTEVQRALNVIFMAGTPMYMNNDPKLPIEGFHHQGYYAHVMPGEDEYKVVGAEKFLRLVKSERRHSETPCKNIGLSKHGEIVMLEHAICHNITDYETHRMKMPAVFIYDKKTGEPIDVKYFIKGNEFSRDRFMELMSSPLAMALDGKGENEIISFMKRVTNDIDLKYDNRQKEIIKA